jgi:cysteine desulfurase
VKGVQIIFASSPVNFDLIRFFPTRTNMPGIASTSLRQASHLCLKQSASAASLLRSSTTARVAAISQTTVKRGYVSATKKDSAQVNVDTAIRAEQKAFFAETGKLPEKQIIPGTSANADAMMSPMAGTALKKGGS